MALILEVDLENIEEVSGGNSPLESGTYDLQIADVKETTAKSGSEGYEIEFNILDSKRKLWDRFYIGGTVSDKGRAFALGRLKSLITSAVKIEGTTKNFNLEKLLGKKVTAEVKLVEAQGEYKAKNEIKSYSEFSGVTEPEKKAAAKKALDESDDVDF